MKKYIILVCIIVLAIITRGYVLGSAPHGLYIDEAGQGYSAYSILKTGKDEFGKSFPIIFRSFLDFKTPIYIYFLVPVIRIFGLHAFAVRLPSFLFSVCSVPVLYLLLKRLTGESSKLPLISALLLALSPWHIFFGRSAFECNLALFFVLLGLLAFFKGLKAPQWFLLSSISFALSMHAYHAERIITPLVMLILFLRYRKDILKKTHKTYIVLSIILGFVILFPLLLVVETPGFSARAAGLTIFNFAKQDPHGYISGMNTLAVIANWKPFLSLKEFISLYISYFNPRNMFVIGDSDVRSSYPYLAPFFLWQLPLYFIGLFALIKEKKLKELRFVTIVLLLVSPLPAAFTRDPYSTIRSLPLVIPQIVIIALGIQYGYTSIKKAALKQGAIVAFFLLMLYSLLKLYSSVIVLNEYYRAPQWNYGWREVVETVESVNSTNLPVIVDNSRDEPYMHILFFTQFDPLTYQQSNPEVSDFDYYRLIKRNTTKNIGYFITRPIMWNVDLKHEGYLVGDALAISKEQIAEHHLTLIKEIVYPDGSPAFRIVKVSP